MIQLPPNLCAKITADYLNKIVGFFIGIKLKVKFEINLMNSKILSGFQKPERIERIAILKI